MNPERRLILDSVAKVREGVDPHRNPNFGQHTLRIPEQDFYALLKLFPKLNALDPAERTAAWESFHNSPYAEKYRVNRLSRGYLHNGNIIK
jgi:hypothetical protein